MKALREGFTTGSCAAAAALASCLWQRDGACPERVSIVVPAGRTYAPEILPHEDFLCGVIKDAGDDPDITNGMEITARVRISAENGPISYRAGEGVGTVTEPGLKVPVGEPAINPVPRQMIEEAVRRVIGDRAACVTVSIPGGVEVARKTFNPRLGIAGGLSVLGTTAIVRPMSEEALKESLYEELKMRAAQGHRYVLFTFGNQGEEAMHRLFPGVPVVQVSNETGFMLDSALELGFARILLGGHPGKLVKVSAGIMQTHSHTADGRREAIITQLALMGAPLSLIEAVYAGKTTDVAIAAIQAAGFETVWDRLAEAARRYCELRVRGEMTVDIAFVDGQGKLLGQSIKGEA